MPQVNRALMVQLGIILLIVPVQYFITQRWKPTSKVTQQQTVKDMVKYYRDWQNKILTKATWVKWYRSVRDSFVSYKNQVFEEATTYMTTSKAPPYETASVVQLDETSRQILRRRDKDGNFASSAVARNPRPANIKYRIGQVIRHKEYGYRGVIVGWDATAKAPEAWLNAMHGKHRPSADTPYYAVLVDISYEFYEDGATVYIPQHLATLVTADTTHLRQQPSYSVLVDLRDRAGGQITYVVEQNIIEIQGQEITHPQVKDYFNGFNGKQYIAKPWLKEIYPHDQ